MDSLLYFLCVDLLCSSCQECYPRLNIYDLSDEDVHEWAARMQCATFGQDAKRAREFLVAEQSRFRKRAEAMELASEAAVSPCEQTGKGM